MPQGRAALYGPPLVVAAVTAAVFFRVLDFPFLNWDDQEVFIRNDALRAPGFLGWAFTTRYMEHYQPLAWLTWGAVERTVGLTAASAHGLNLALHAGCAVLVYAVVRRYSTTWAAAGASLFWAIHPLRVEVVAWASAMPYSLALLFALLSMLAWMAGRSWTAVALFALSLLARPIALALPLVWIVARRSYRPAVVGLAIAGAAALAESSARLTATLAEFGVGARLTLAAAAPWRYLWRTILPVNLTPLDPLALTPHTDVWLIVIGFSATTGASLAAWRWRRDYPVLAGCWLAYLVLLGPAMGFVPSGLQATADRYTYVAAVPLSIGIAQIAMLATTKVVALQQLRTRVLTVRSATTSVVAIAATIALAAVGAATWQQTEHWRDSIALWTRAVEIDARNDVALYNLATALDETGRRDEALARYEQVLAIVPDHPEATRNRDLLRARSLEEEGNQLAAAGKLGAAVPRYAEAVRLDPRRTHSQAALGMALTQLGRFSDARTHLRTAVEQGINDPAVPNALAYVLMQAGDREGALAVLREAQRRFPSDENIARNIALIEK